MQYFLELFLKCFAPKRNVLYHSVQEPRAERHLAWGVRTAPWAGSVHGAAHLSPPARPPAGAAALPAG